MVENKLVKINVNDFKSKGSGKAMLYNFLAVENHVYLPEQNQVTVWFLR